MQNMKKIISIFIVSIMLLSSLAFASGGNTYYVSAIGNDDGTGTRENPFPSLKAAKEAISGEDGAKVVFLDGKYNITEKVTFTEKDSGTQASPITYEADENAEVVFTGAAPLNKELFTKVQDVDILKKLPESSRSKVLQLDLTKQGLTTVSAKYPVLYVNDSQATIARYPNEGYKVYNLLSVATYTIDTEYENVANWSAESLAKASLVGNLSAPYTWNTTAITEVSGTEITVEKSFRKKQLGYSTTAYYYVRNLIEELDAPGEYIVEDNILYYYPTSSLEDLDMEIALFEDDTMIELNGAEYINFKGITFEKAISGAINTADKYTNGITIKDCNFKYLINEVLNIRGFNHTISNNYAYGCGSRFLGFMGGSRKGLTPGNIIIEKNRIVGCGYWSLAQTLGVIYGGEASGSTSKLSIGNKVINNIIQDCYSSAAINVTGNDNEIKNNEIINMGLVVEDGGAIYSGKSATKYGSVIENNYIHDFKLDNDYCAIYPDDGMSGITIKNNIVARVSKAMTIGLGANVTIKDNLFVNVSKGMSIGQRMYGSDVNGVYKGEGKLYREAYNAVYNEDEDIANAYNTKYPVIKEMVDTHDKKGYPFFAPWNSLIKGNVSIGTANAVLNETSSNHTLKTAGAYNVPGEDKLHADGKIVLVGSNTVDVLGTYGPESERKYNGTNYGNPKVTYSDSLFTNVANQDYSLKASVSDLSNVHNISMTNIGINGTTNEKIFEEENGVKILDVAYDRDQATITWEPVENASTYDITVTNGSATVASETDFRNIFHTNKYTFDLDGAGEYNVKVVAKGLSREDSFTEEGTKTFTVSEKYTANLENALAILKDRMEAEGYTNSNADELMRVYNENSALISADQATIDQAELAVYDAIALATPTAAPEVTRFEADEHTNIVFVEAIGFPANSLATVMVTNPDVKFEDVKTNATTETIKYIATVKTDALGRICVEFDTSKNEIDYTGVYKLYVKANNDSAKIEKEYTYGTVELSDVVFKSGDSVITKDDLVPGQEVTLSVNVNNRLPRELTPEVYLGIYEGNVLKDAFVQNQTAISANDDGTIEISVVIPQTYTAENDLKLFMWDDENGKLLRPLTKTRVISE